MVFFATGAWNRNEVGRGVGPAGRATRLAAGAGGGNEIDCARVETDYRRATGLHRKEAVDAPAPADAAGFTSAMIGLCALDPGGARTAADFGYFVLTPG
jgi:hypothetical protein